MYIDSDGGMIAGENIVFRYRVVELDRRIGEARMGMCMDSHRQDVVYACATTGAVSRGECGPGFGTGGPDVRIRHMRPRLFGKPFKKRVVDPHIQVATDEAPIARFSGPQRPYYAKQLLMAKPPGISEVTQMRIGQTQRTS